MSLPTTALLDFLSDPASYHHQPKEVRMVQTHASWVFIAPPLVYKIKKPVNFGFIDFSTLELRHEDCVREVALNRRLAEDIYLDVVEICESNGVLHLGGGGTVVEYAVKMRELDRQYLLTQMLKENTASTADLDRVLALLQKFYTVTAPPPPNQAATATERLHKSIFDNLKVAGDFAGICLQQPELEALLHFNEEFFTKRAALLKSRIEEERIRDCHGDLHAEHIHITPEAVRIYDCIEFNTRFRYIDAACDLAFLAMDLDYHGRPDLSRHLVNRAATLLDDPAMKSLMAFYQCYRACVRAKVQCLQTRTSTADEAAKQASLGIARRYYHLALRYALAGTGPCMFLVMGKVGSGKSLIAGLLAKVLDCQVLSSDHVRKTLAGVDLHERGSKEQRMELYSAEMTSRTYEKMFEEAARSLAAGSCVVLDATFSKHSQREAAKQCGGRAVWIEVEVSEETAKERLLGRESAPGVVSDARLEDQAQLDSKYEAPQEIDKLVSISSEGEIDGVLSRLLLSLAERSVLN